MNLDADVCYRALQTRDARFDGRFFTAVCTTGIYCRPVCPARTPKFENCRFFPSAAAAQEAGYRPCLRCRPEASPELFLWRGTLNTISRSLRLIGEGALDEAGVETLAARVGVGARHLRRLFDRHVGASPIAVAQTRRLLFAKRLIDETSLPMTEIAFASGFGSLRRFNATVQRTYRRSPRELRRRNDERRGDGDAVALRLPFAPPYDWDGIAAFLSARAIPGVESVRDGAYRRTVALGGKHGTVEVRPVAGARHLLATIRFPDVAELASIVSRLRRLFDLDADPDAIAAHLGRDAHLAPLVAARPGLRVPGCWDGFELAVRAILGQQVSVAAATTLAGRLVARCGTPVEPSVGDGDLGFAFPAPSVLADADLGGIGLPRARAESIRRFAAVVAQRRDLLDAAKDLESAVESLRALPGIGEWTAQYIAMRALREPDAFPAADLGLLRAMANGAGRPTPKALMDTSAAWRPWRSYAALYLWTVSPAVSDEGRARLRRAAAPPRLAGRLALPKMARREVVRPAEGAR